MVLCSQSELQPEEVDADDDDGFVRNGDMAVFDFGFHLSMPLEAKWA